MLMASTGWRDQHRGAHCMSTAPHGLLPSRAGPSVRVAVSRAGGRLLDGLGILPSHACPSPALALRAAVCGRAPHRGRRGRRGLCFWPRAGSSQPPCAHVHVPHSSPPLSPGSGCLGPQQMSLSDFEPEGAAGRGLPAPRPDSETCGMRSRPCVPDRRRLVAHLPCPPRSQTAGPRCDPEARDAACHSASENRAVP